MHAHLRGRQRCYDAIKDKFPTPDVDLIKKRRAQEVADRVMRENEGTPDLLAMRVHGPLPTRAR